MLRSAIHLLKPLSNRADRDLLADYLASRDEQTFAELARRHTGMIRRIAADLVPDLADDVVQATFVLFQKKASTIADRESAAGWLCQTARRLALKARTSAARRRTRETTTARNRTSADPVDELSLREVRAIVVEELNALSESLRLPLLLVYWEGSSQLQAGSRLGCSLSTLKRRLDEGRDKLAARLKRRGFAPNAVLTVLAVTAAGSSAASPNAIGIASPLALELAKSSGWTAFAGPLAATVMLVVAGAGIGAGFMKADDPKPNAPIAQAKPVVSTTPQAPVDTVGDPIPANALVRLGSNRLRGNRAIMFPDGKRIAREVGNGNLQISEIPSGKPLAVIRAKDMPEREMIVGSTVGFTPDGKRMAAVCWKGRCGIWDTDSGKLIRWVECSFFSVVQANFSPDGRYLAVGFQPNQQKINDFKVFVYDLESGDRIIETKGGCVGVFSKDGKSLTTWNDYGNHDDPPARISIPDGAVLSKEIPIERRRLKSFQIAGPDSDWYFDVYQDNNVTCKNLITGEQFATLTLDLNDEKNSTHVIASNRTEEVVLVSYKSKIMAGFNPKDGKELWRKNVSISYVPSLMPDGRTIRFPESAKRELAYYDMKTGKETRSVKFLDNGQSLPREFTPDGRYGISQSNSIFASAAVVWDMATGKPLSEVPGHTAAIMACSFSRDGRTAFTASDDNTVRVWDAATGKQQLEIRTPKPGFVAASPDCSTIYVASRMGTIESFDAKTGEKKVSVKAFATALAGMALSSDGKQLIAAGRIVAKDAGSVSLYDPATLKEIRSFDLTGKPCEQMALQAEGKSVAIAHEGRSISLWSLETGQSLSTWKGEANRVSSWVEKPKPTPYEIGSLTLSANGRWLAFSDQEKGIACVDLQAGKSAGHANTDCYYQNSAARYELSDAVAFSPDGRTVAYSGSESSTKVILIDVRTRQIRRTFTADNEQTRSLAWSPDGTKLLSAGADGIAIIWNVNAPTGNATPVADWWTKLAQDKPADVEGLMAEMTAKPADTLALLKQHLKPVPAVDSDEVGKLIAALDAADFDEREKATKRLHALADQARNQLKDAHRAIASAEVKKRLKEVLDGVDEAKPMQGDKLRFARAIELLERIGTAEAKALLTAVATGAADAQMTVDAAESLARIGKK